MLDDMIPRCIADQAGDGGLVIEPYDHAIVLVVSCIVPDAATVHADGRDALARFRLLHCAHTAFDSLLRRSKLPVFKRSTSGHDYILISATFLHCALASPVTPPPSAAPVTPPPSAALSPPWATSRLGCWPPPALSSQAPAPSPWSSAQASR